MLMKIQMFVILLQSVNRSVFLSVWLQDCTVYEIEEKILEVVSIVSPFSSGLDVWRCQSENTHAHKHTQIDTQTQSRWNTYFLFLSSAGCPVSRGCVYVCVWTCRFVYSAQDRPLPVLDNTSCWLCCCSRNTESAGVKSLSLGFRCDLTTSDWCFGSVALINTSWCSCDSSGAASGAVKFP